MKITKESMFPVQWAAIAGSLAVLVWSVPGLIVNPDFALGDEATSVRVLGVDRNGWHALSGFLVGVPGLFAALRASWSGFLVVKAAVALIATRVWALLDSQPVGGLFYFPRQHRRRGASLCYVVDFRRGGRPLLLLR